MESSSLPGRDLRHLFDRVPDGFTEVDAAGARWGLVGTSAGDGRARRFTARRFEDGHVLGANLYTTASGSTLHPCEVPPQDVLDFLAGFVVVGPRRDSGSPLVAVGGLRALWVCWRFHRTWRVPWH